MTKSRYNLLTGTGPLPARQVEQAGREGGEKGHDAGVFHSHQVAQDVQQDLTHVLGREKRERGEKDIEKINMSLKSRMCTDLWKHNRIIHVHTYM